ncbi:MAG: hypothetical protein KAY37_17970 [Phycisphaerae bacterium]|nr:hypothetical protein [Phycisphaerae bacterium]
MSQNLPRAERPQGRRFRWPAFPKPAPLEWLCLVGGLYLTIHYSWLMDDAYVYFRYADNLLYLQRGLVFNAGEYVEGFSSPLWMILLIALRATGLNYWLMTRLLGVTAFLVFWILLVVLNRRLTPPRGPVLNFPLCYLALNYGVLCYFTSGLETPLVQIAAVVYALFVLNPASGTLQVLLALTPLLRHELVLPFAVCLLWTWLRRKKFPLRMTLAGVGFTGVWVIFRIYYYADLFPNTFYLKDTVDFTQGLIYLQDTAGTYWLYPVLGAFVVLALIAVFRHPVRSRVEPPQEAGSAPIDQVRKSSAGRRRRKSSGKKRPDNKPAQKMQPRPDEASESGAALEIRKRLLLVALAGCIALYVIKIGGDPRHYRYLAFPFCLCICVCAGLVEQVVARFSLPAPRIILTAVGLLVIARAATFYPPQLDAHPFGGEEKCEFVNKINDASGHRHNKTLAQSPWSSGAEKEIKGRYAEFRARNPACGHTGLAVGSWCVTLYERFDDRFVQALGLTDPILARTEMKADRPAHKLGLNPLAKDLGRLVGRFGNAPRRGMYRKAVEQGRAPPWVAENLESIEIIEHKMLNTHDFIENLRLAFTFPEKIRIPPRLETRN